VKLRRVLCVPCSCKFDKSLCMLQSNDRLSVCEELTKHFLGWMELRDEELECIMVYNHHDMQSFFI